MPLAIFERLGHFRQVEHHIPQFAPVLTAIPAAHDADRPLELPAIEPQFAIEGNVRQSGGEPLGGEKLISQPRQEGAAIPKGPHAIELLAHPPAGNVGFARPAFGQQQGERFVGRFPLSAVGFRRRVSGGWRGANSR